MDSVEALRKVRDKLYNQLRGIQKYITSIDNDFYTITISGPKEKKDEVSDLASKVFKTLEKNTSD